LLCGISQQLAAHFTVQVYYLLYIRCTSKQQIIREISVIF